MFTDEELIQFALTELSTAASTKPWMTASSIIKKIRRNQGINLQESSLESALEKESYRRRRRIRYSMYPSARSLKILWGAISLVGDRSVPSLILEKDNKQIESDSHADSDKHAVFVSHNYKDKTDVLNLCKKLEHANIPAWIFEAEIQEGDTIINEVRSAIDHTPICILYVSKNSIGSTWVRKEVLNARGGVRPVVKYADTDILTYLNQLDAPPTRIPEQLLENCKTSLQRESAKKLLDYMYECFVRNRHKIYIHDRTSHACDTGKLIEEIATELGISTQRHSA